MEASTFVPTKSDYKVLRDEESLQRTPPRREDQTFLSIDSHRAPYSSPRPREPMCMRFWRYMALRMTLLMVFLGAYFLFMFGKDCVDYLRGANDRGDDQNSSNDKVLNFDNIGAMPAPEENPGCKIYFDGCNTCSRSTYGGAAACTERFCEKSSHSYCKAYFEPSEMKKVSSANEGSVMPTIPSPAKEDMNAPDDCALWNTGCNNCRRSTPGAPLVCTRMMCHGDLKPGSCSKYFDSSSETGDKDAAEGGIAPITITDPSPETETKSEDVAQRRPMTKPLKVRIPLPAGTKEISNEENASTKSTTTTTTTDPAPDDCKVWFDGCNTCSRGAPGAPLGCTRRACFTTSEPYCMAEFSD
mmetsp:Transcript_22700/g.36616  ORF Transcript_22700/g.36616 Transcript_22700/m.36616 type:complete len:357 (-) Transcript_22700:262-1332(-)|eukprot:CAMPEP_0171496166 /NCGR_PEP_ID=MMETSP0958-20121227/6547_1 /TAXON_ID=87120 /ORGANISM="Aurantiochytrium limacinum, Strain ATCCMYA-1381" /LENGTH=356 /DNA_ID=CAMNT_0012030231 /DNA_START=145 /DNA_END=1215 /DNA_ORIENTATION=+